MTGIIRTSLHMHPCGERGRASVDLEGAYHAHEIVSGQGIISRSREFLAVQWSNKKTEMSRKSQEKKHQYRSKSPSRTQATPDNVVNPQTCHSNGVEGEDAQCHQRQNSRSHGCNCKKKPRVDSGSRTRMRVK